MKKRLFTLALVTAASVSFGQGTIQFANNALTKVRIYNGITSMYVPTTPNLINYGVFWGTSSDNLSLSPYLGKNSTVAAGIIDAPYTYAIPGAWAGSTVWMQIKAWDASFGSDWSTALHYSSYFAQTDIRQVTLASELGPGTVIWQTWTGTSPNRFYPITFAWPEPSSASIALVAGAIFFVVKRKRA